MAQVTYWAMSLPRPKIATDKSARRVDEFGHMHVEMSNISKANVCPYYGREIPDAERLGLDMNRIYMLYRHPDELRRAAESFSHKPLLMHHIPVTGDEPSRDLWVGTTGAVVFDGTYLKAPLAMWTTDAVDVVEKKTQEELSPGYAYRADMTRGRTPQGVAYDGVMRDIKGNHVALVKEGRTGHDVVVADSNPLEFTRMKFRSFVSTLATMLGATPPAESLVALDAALDADLEAANALDALNDEEKDMACDSFAKTKGKAKADLNDEEKSEAYKRAAADKKVTASKSASKSPAASEGAAAPHAADEAAVKLAVDTAVAAAISGSEEKQTAAVKLAVDTAVAATHALYDARRAVEATVGVVAMDTAEAVLRFALDHLKVEHKDVPAAALRALYDASVKVATAAPLATDSAVAFDISSIYTKG